MPFVSSFVAQKDTSGSNDVMALMRVIFVCLCGHVILCGKGTLKKRLKEVFMAKIM